MENIKLRLNYEKKLLEYYSKVGDQKLLDDLAASYREKDWRVVAVEAITVSVLDPIENQEEYITKQIKYLDELINEK